MVRSRSLLLVAAVAGALIVILLVLLGALRRDPALHETIVEGAAPATSDASPLPAPDAALEARSESGERRQITAASALPASTGPLQLRGRVLDNFGTPLDGASLTIAEIGAAKPGVVHLVTEADGSFEARADWKSKQLVVRVLHPSCWNAVHKQIDSGLEDVSFVLERCASIRGVLLMANRDPLPDLELGLRNTEGLSGAGARLTFQSDPEAVRNRGPEQLSCSMDGSFTISLLRPGRYALEVRGLQGLGVLARIPDITLRSGEVWSTSETNPLLLDASAAQQVEVYLDSYPALGAGDTLRVFLLPSPEGSSVQSPVRGGEFELESDFNFERDRGRVGEPDLPSAAVKPGHGQRVTLPGVGRYQLCWCLERKLDNAGKLQVIPLRSEQPQYAEVHGARGFTQLRVELDARQLALIERGPVR